MIFDLWSKNFMIYDFFFCECKRAPELDNQQVYLPRLYQFWMKKE